MTDHTAALLPCPFCGGTKVVMTPPTCKRTDKYNPADRAFPIVHCVTCYAEVNGKNWDQTGVSAIAAWNRRAQPQQPAGWRPIETAPKDGTRFIGLGPTPSDGGIEARETCWSFFGQGSLAKAAFDRGEGPSGNWRWCEPIHNWASSWNPTHWMPLPPPPGAHPSQQEDDVRDAAPVTFDIEAAAKVLAECMDYPWARMPEGGRNHMRKHAQAVIDAAMTAAQGDAVQGGNV